MKGRARLAGFVGGLATLPAPRGGFVVRIDPQGEIDRLLAERERLLARIAEMAGERRTLAADRDRLADGLEWANWRLEREEEKVPGTCPECGLWCGVPPGHPFPPPDWWLGCLLCWWDFQRGLV